MGVTLDQSKGDTLLSAKGSTPSTWTRLSSTRNRLCGDLTLSKGDKVRYFVNCLRDSLFSNRDQSKAHRTRQAPLHLPDEPDKLPLPLNWRASPSHLMCDALWQALPWDRIAAILGQSVRVLELGCGSGSRIGMLRTFLGDSLVSYIGIDVKRRDTWSALMAEEPRARFIQTAAESLPPDVLRESNLIVSQSVLEHVRGDLDFFVAHAKHVAQGAPSIHIHAVPAEVSLLLYLFHGWRQYSLDTIHRIAATYSDKRLWVASLGGVRAFALHALGITIPTVLRLASLRNVAPDLWGKLLRTCYDRERTLNSRFPTFYAFILQVGTSTPLWEPSESEQGESD